MNPFHRHFIFGVSLLGGVIAFAASFVLMRPMAVPIGANAFFVIFIALVLREIPRLTADFLSRHAQEADEPAWVIFLVTAAIVGIAVESLFELINAKHLSHLYWLLFSTLSLPLGWFTIHSMAALHYADLYWRGDKRQLPGNKHNRGPIGGIAFPKTERPVGWDFLYFAVVIGMTAQTADVDITSTRMRMVAMVHSILSFFFNTIIIAAAVNLVVSLAG